MHDARTENDELLTLYTPIEIAEILGLNLNSVYQLLGSGVLKALRYGRVWRIPKLALQEYILSSSNL